MARTRFALSLYFRMVSHKAACHTLANVCVCFLSFFFFFFFFSEICGHGRDSVSVKGTFHLVF